MISRKINMPKKLKLKQKKLKACTFNQIDKNWSSQFIHKKETHTHKLK
jgi:hypothetical protein